MQLIHFPPFPGILLLTTVHQRNSSEPTSAVQLSSVELTEWQLRVRNSSSSFYDLCDSMRMVPNIWALYEWSDWLTPVSVGHRRFDTIFYVCCLGRKPEVKVDNAEVTKPIVRVCPLSQPFNLKANFRPLSRYSGAVQRPFLRSIVLSRSSSHHLKSTN